MMIQLEDYLQLDFPANWLSFLLQVLLAQISACWPGPGRTGGGIPANAPAQWFLPCQPVTQPRWFGHPDAWHFGSKGNSGGRVPGNWLAVRKR